MHRRGPWSQGQRDQKHCSISVVGSRLLLRNVLGLQGGVHQGNERNPYSRRSLVRPAAWGLRCSFCTIGSDEGCPPISTKSRIPEVHFPTEKCIMEHPKRLNRSTQAQTTFAISSMTAEAFYQELYTREAKTVREVIPLILLLATTPEGVLQIHNACYIPLPVGS